MIRIVVVDDHAIVRSGICHLINAQPDMEVVGEAGNGRDAVKVACEHTPDVLLLDMELPDIDGLAVTEQVHQSSPDTAILILTMYESEDIAHRSMKLGALGYLIKGTDPAELPEAIRTVSCGKPYVTPTIRDKMLIQHFKGDSKENPLAFLSNRELQILVEMANGCTTTQVSEKLCISKSTVKTYKNRIHEKLGLENISEIIRFCIRNGLIDKY